MQRKPLKHTGDKTSPAQQRINRANSIATLARLLELNFPEGAQMITLGYESAVYAPVGECAEADIRAWVRLARAQVGRAFQYVRTLEQGQDNGPATVHRIVTACKAETVAELAACWHYGPTSMNAVAAGELPALAGRLAANVAEPNRKTWVSSRGLKRP